MSESEPFQTSAALLQEAARILESWKPTHCGDMPPTHLLETTDTMCLSAMALLEASRSTQTGTADTWAATLPCPDCGLNNVIGISLVLEGYGHNHTKYFCRSWVKPTDEPKVGRPCGWEGWTVPGWDRHGVRGIGQ